MNLSLGMEERINNFQWIDTENHHFEVALHMLYVWSSDVKFTNVVNTVQ